MLIVFFLYKKTNCLMIIKNVEKYRETAKLEINELKITPNLKP